MTRSNTFAPRRTSCCRNNAAGSITSAYKKLWKKKHSPAFSANTLPGKWRRRHEEKARLARVRRFARGPWYSAAAALVSWHEAGRGCLYRAAEEIITSTPGSFHFSFFVVTRAVDILALTLAQTTAPRHQGRCTINVCFFNGELGIGLLKCKNRAWYARRRVFIAAAHAITTRHMRSEKQPKRKPAYYHPPAVCARALSVGAEAL